MGIQIRFRPLTAAGTPDPDAGLFLGGPQKSRPFFSAPKKPKKCTETGQARSLEGGCGKILVGTGEELDKSGRLEFHVWETVG
jgi:hypothetical protein